MMNIDKMTRLPGIVEQLKAVVGARYDEAKDWLLKPGEVTEHYSKEDWLLAQQQVAKEWFSGGVKTDEALASLISGIGSIMSMFGIQKAGRAMAESGAGRAMAAVVVGAGLGLVAYDQAFGHGVDMGHAMGHDAGALDATDTERGLVLSQTDLAAGPVQVFHGDGIALINVDGSGAYLAPGVHLYNGEKAFDGSTVIDLAGPGVEVLKIDDGEKPPFTRYTITFGPGEWDTARMLVMSPGQRNNTQVMLHRLEKVDGYGGTGRLFVDVTPDFSGKTATVNISGFSEQDQYGIVTPIDLGSDHVKGVEVFPTTTNAKEAVLIPATVDTKQVIVVVPTEYTNIKVGEDGLWQAIDEKGNALVFKNGEWVKAASQAELFATSILEDNGIELDAVTLSVDERGMVKAIDTETSELMLQTDGVRTWYEINIAVGIAAQSCEHTPFKPDSYGRMTVESSQGLAEYVTELANDLDYFSGGSARLDSFNILLDRENQCWAFSNGVDLLWRDEEGVAQKLGLVRLTRQQIFEFAMTKR